jgi:hypothetical protein
VIATNASRVLFRQMRKLLVVIAMNIASVSLMADEQFRESVSASEDSLFVQITLHGVVPSNRPVQIGLTAYRDVSTRLATYHLKRDGGMDRLAVGWHDNIPWSQFQASEAITAGETSGWMDWSPLFSEPRFQTPLLIALWQPDKQLDDKTANALKNDDGNVEAYDIELKFATRPDSKNVVHSVRYASKFQNLALLVPSNDVSSARWIPGIRTLLQYTQDRLSEYQNRGVRPLLNRSELEITVDVMKGYHGSFYDPATDAIEQQICSLLGENHLLRIVNVRPDHPWDTTMESAKLELQTQVVAPHDKRFSIQLGDEPHIPSIASLMNSPSGLRLFRSWLRKQGETLANLQLESWQVATPMERSDVKTPGQAKLHYHTIWFLQESAIRFLRCYREAAHELWGHRVSVMTDAYFAGFDTTPDYFLESRRHATDRFGHHFAGEFNPYLDIFEADMFRSASRFGKTRSGMIHFACRINEPEGVLMTTQLALSRGIHFFRYYGYGPSYSGWEWFSDDRYKTEVFAATARGNETAVRFADYFCHSVQRRPKIATLLSRSARIWSESKESEMIDLFGHPEAKESHAKLLREIDQDGAAEGWSCERDMIHSALNWAGYDVDVIPEEEIESGRLSDGYRVLYVYEPNLTIAAQRRLAQWVRDGGVVYLGPQSATRDEGNASSELIELLCNKNSSSVSAEKLVTAVSFEPKGNFRFGTPSDDSSRSVANFNERSVNQLQTLDTVTVQNAALSNFTHGILSQDTSKFSAVGWKEIIHGGIENEPVLALAKYADGAIAVGAIKAGRGWVVKAGTNLGAMYARTAVPSLDQQWYSAEEQRVPAAMVLGRRTTGSWIPRSKDSLESSIQFHTPKAAQCTGCARGDRASSSNRPIHRWPRNRRRNRSDFRML